MKHRDVRVYLYDAAEACERILRFTGGRTPEEYLADELQRSAVERQFMILGEALARASSLDPTLDSRVSDLARIAALRNRLVHAYEAIDPRIVWAIVQTDVPALRAALGTI